MCRSKTVPRPAMGRPIGTPNRLRWGLHRLTAAFVWPGPQYPQSPAATRGSRAHRMRRAPGCFPPRRSHRRYAPHEACAMGCRSARIASSITRESVHWLGSWGPCRGGSGRGTLPHQGRRIRRESPSAVRCPAPKGLEGSECRLQDSNLQPPYYKYGALPIAPSRPTPPSLAMGVRHGRITVPASRWVSPWARASRWRSTCRWRPSGRTARTRSGHPAHRHRPRR